MKYVKLFESFSDIDTLVQDAKDICLELNDAGIETECEYNNPVVLSGISYPGYISIYVEVNTTFVVWDEVEEVIDRLIDYFESCGWGISTILIDDYRVSNPKEWIEDMRIKDTYSFDDLAISFRRSEDLDKPKLEV